MADYPTGAYITGSGVKNVALEFSTCMYKASEVPTETRRENINFAKPLTCFEWENVYVYDFAKARFEANWAEVPKPKAPAMRIALYLLITLAILFIALALLTFSSLNRFLRERDRD